MIPLVGGRNRISISRSHSFAASQASEYFFAGFEDADPDVQFRGVDTAIDNNLNVYALGSYTAVSSGPPNYFLAKYDKYGNLLWQFEFGDIPRLPFGNQYEPRRVRMHPDGNVIVAGVYGATFGLVIKVSPAGALVWQSSLGVDSADFTLKSMAVQSNGNIVMVGVSSGFQVITRMDANGTLIGNGTGTNTTGQDIDIAIDSNGDFVTVSSDTVSATNGVVTTWFDTSLNVIRQRYLSNPFYCDGLRVACDGSGNAYVTGLSYEASFPATYVAKYDVTGTLQYIKAIQATLPALTMTPTGIAVQSNGTTYVLAYSVFAGSSELIMIKLDNAGNLLLARRIGVAGSNDYSERINLDTLNNVYVSGGFGSWMFTGKIPNDGSLTGSYTLLGNTIDYQAFTYLTVGVSNTVADASFNGNGPATNNTLAYTGTAATPAYTDDTVVL